METLMTSEDWYPLYQEKLGREENKKVIIYDPDGWDRKNYTYSWSEELITLDEFEKRVCESTVLMEKIK